MHPLALVECVWGGTHPAGFDADHGSGAGEQGVPTSISQLEGECKNDAHQHHLIAKKNPNQFLPLRQML